MAYSIESCMVSREKAEKIRKRETERKKKFDIVTSAFKRMKVRSAK